jgi:WhiB family redox-sensing transcriptional regulator
MSTVRRLPGPIADIWEWQRRGACRGRDSGQFFHPDGERGSSRARREEAAKAVCVGCPVRAECAAHALMVREPYGVWGGFTETERLRLMATGWQDLIDPHCGRADVPLLEQRLGGGYRPRAASGAGPGPARQLTAPQPRRPSARVDAA